MRIEPIGEMGLQVAAGTPAKEKGGGFAKALKETVEEVNALQVQADVEAQRLATGQAENIHDAVLAMEKAALALELTIQVTKKAVEAYQEIHRIQV